MVPFSIPEPTKPGMNPMIGIEVLCGYPVYWGMRQAEDVIDPYDDDRTVKILRSIAGRYRNDHMRTSE